MTGKELFESMSYVDERFVEEAERSMRPANTVQRKWLALAACLCLILLGLHQSWSPAVTERVPESTMPCETAPAGVSVESIEEVPAVILRVEELTGQGFRGTVTELVDTDIFEVGMELTVIVKPDARLETEADQIGSCVMVRFVSYDEASQTITVNQIQEPKG